MPRPVFVQSMKGLGDNVYQRPFVAAESTRRAVYLDTPWPQLYADLPNVFPVRPATTLRTQEKNAAAQPYTVWHEKPFTTDKAAFGYGTQTFRRQGIVSALERCLPLKGSPFVFDLPTVSLMPVGEQYAVVRPVTVRKEWTNTARNPDPSAVFKVAMWLQDMGVRVILVADLKDGEEQTVGALPPHDEAFLHGELSVDDLMLLVGGAAACVGGVGWIVPMAIAAGTPLFVVQGGQLRHNGPAAITDPRMNLTRVGWARPRYPCDCESMRHNCRKDPANLRGDFDEWTERVGLIDPRRLSA